MKLPRLTLIVRMLTLVALFGSAPIAMAQTTALEASPNGTSAAQPAQPTDGAQFVDSSLLVDTSLLTDGALTDSALADSAQQTPAAAAPPAKPVRGFVSALSHNLVDDVKHIPRRNSVYWLAGGIGLALAVHPIDHSLNAHLEGHTDPFIAGQYIGSLPAILGAGFAAYIFGRVEGDYPRTEHLGMDEIEAALLSEGIVEVSKNIIRRPRPMPTTGFFNSGYSMPSGHATMTFAAATVLQQHLGYKAAIPTYLIATYVAMSRLHDNVHYASDVVMGAATGIIIGRSVTWHGRNFYGELQPTPGGVGVGFATR